jgi:hypothetical protein
MQAVTLGLNHQLSQYPGTDPLAPASLGNTGSMDQAQLQQLVQLLGAKMLPKQTAVVECPKSMVGRVIGKGGETIKALQQYTGAMIQASVALVLVCGGCVPRCWGSTCDWPATGATCK